MCKRQIDQRPNAPEPSNDNNPTPAERLETLGLPGLRSGILSVALERTDRVRLDFVAGGVLTIQGQKTPRNQANALRSGRNISHLFNLTVSPINDCPPGHKGLV